MSHLKKIIKIVVNIFTCFLLLLLALVIYGKMVVTFSDKSFPNYFGYTFFEVASGSMEPTLKINDVILVKIDNADLKKGDIIAFYSENIVITHRILFIDGTIITVKGDNNSVVDKPIVKEQVIGKVVKILPELGVWKKVLTEPKILLAIFITLLLFDFALSYENKDKKSDKSITKTGAEKEIAKEVLTDSLAHEIPQKKKIESTNLLELTRKIDIEEINKLLEGTEYKLEKKEINNIKKEVDKITENQSEFDSDSLFTEREKKALEYTLRLDLNEIQKKIMSKVK